MSYHSLPEAFKFGNKVEYKEKGTEKEYEAEHFKHFLDQGQYHHYRYYHRDF
jgi:hypothetical protein